MRNFLIVVALFFLWTPFQLNAQFISCNEIDCGQLEPSWKLVGGLSKVCEGQSFLLTAEESTPLDNIESYRWIIYKNNFEILLDTTFNDLTNLEYLFEVDDEDIEDQPCDDPEINFQVNLIVSSPACAGGMSCRNSLEPLTVVLEPRADFEDVQQACEGIPVVFNNTSCYGNSYTWDFGDGTVISTTEIAPLMHTYAAEGTYEVTLTAMNTENDCGEDIEVKEVEVIGLPEANAEFVLDPATGCTDLNVVFTNQVPDFANNSSASWVISPNIGWDFSDTLSNESSWDNAITFTEPGIYTITLTVTNICGMDVWTDMIEVFEAPTADLDSPGNACIETPGASVTISFMQYLSLTGSSCGYDWTITNIDNGEIFTSDLQFPVFTFDDPGEYEVELEIDGCACGDLNESTSFFIETPTNLTFDIPSQVLCSNSDPIQITPSSGGGTWTGSPAIDNDGVFDPALAVIGDNVLTYMVGTGACESNGSVTITVTQAPEVNLTEVPTACDDLDYVPTVTATGNYSTENWTLILEDGTTENYDPTMTSMVQINETGTHQFIVELIGDCNPVTDTIAIEIIASILSVDAGQDDTLCIVQPTYDLMGTPAGGTWQEIGGSNGTGLDAMTGTIDLALAGGGPHQYEYVQAAGTECEISDVVNIEIIDFSGISAGPDIAVCEGTPAFQLNGIPATGGEWSGPGVTNPSGTFDPSTLAPGNSYTLMYCLSNPSINCSACDEMVVSLNPLPVADFQINGTNCVGEILDIENLSLNACEYFWDFGNGETSTLPNPGPVYNIVGNYTITLIAESCEMCLDTFSLMISVTEPAVANFTQDLNEGCSVLEVTFTNQSFGSDVSYFWDFGNGQTSTAESPGTIAFDQGNADTTYLITLAVTNGCGTVEYVDSVTVFPIPIVVFSPNVDDGCSPLPIDFSNISVGNPETYEWYIDGVLVSNDSILLGQVFTTSDTAITIYQITLIANNLCGSDTSDTEIVVFPPDVDAFIFADTTSGCQPLTVNFGNFSTPGAQITWDFGDGNGSSETDPVYTFETAGTFTVYQFASNCGTDVDSVIIEVLPAPEVSFTHDVFVCDGQPIVFQNESIGLDGSFWDFGDGDTSLLDSPEHIFSGPGEYLVTLTGFSSVNNCPASFQSTVTVLGNPEIAFVPSTLNGCAPLSIDFLNTSIGTNTYEWDFGNGEVSSDDNPQNQIFNDPGTYEVILIGTDNFGCFSDTSVINIIVHEIPQAAFSTNDSEYCSTVDLIETTNTSQGASQYYWTFGNGAVIETFEPSQVFQDTGNLAITLIAENSFACRDTAVTEVLILGTPVALATPQVFEGCVPLVVSFENSSEFADAYFWDFDENSNVSSATEPSYTYINPGDYTPIMVASNSNGCPSDTIDFTITVNPLPISDFTLDQNEVCGFADSIFVTNNSSGATDYLWDFDNGMAMSTLFEPAGLYSDTGMYTISLITTNQFSCKDTATQILNILGAPQAEITAPITEACFPASFNFSNTSDYSDGFEWNFGDGDVNSTLLNIDHAYVAEGTYELILMANNSNGCPSDSDTLMITVFPKPVSDFELSETLVCGLPDTIETTNLSQGANDYLWDFGNGLNATTTNPTIVYQAPNDYNVSLLVTNAFGCQDTMIQTVSINLQPESRFEIAPYDGCAPDTLDFINTTADADFWLWDFGDGTISDEFEPTHVYPDPGVYTVQLIAGYNESCFDTLDAINRVTILPSPIAAFNYTDNEDGQIQFINQSVDAVSYDWDLGNGDFSQEVDPFYEYNDNGNWFVTLTATHLNGCTDIDTMTVSPEIFFGLYLPNAMSPEGGVGDVRLFKPAGIGIKWYEVQIYSPLGQLLWENSELDGEQPRGSWDGTFKGKPVPQGAYVWKVEVEYINEIRRAWTGTISIVR